jgi:hypothetical protein
MGTQGFHFRPVYQEQEPLKTERRSPARILLLLPHRDTDRALGDYRRRLFAGGLSGAWSFPGAVPLAILTRPLTAGELGELARSLREASLAGGGWFQTGEPVQAPLPVEARAFPPALALYGPRLGFRGERPFPFPPEKPGPDFVPQAVSRWFPHPVLAAALVRELPPGFRAPEPPALAFRAAALANMVYRPLAGGEEDFSFEWRIGRPVWLPPVKLKKRG